MKTVERALLVLEDTPHPTPAIPRLWRNLNETCHIYRVGPLFAPQHFMAEPTRRHVPCLAEPAMRHVTSTERVLFCAVWKLTHSLLCGTCEERRHMNTVRCPDPGVDRARPHA